MSSARGAVAAVALALVAGCGSHAARLAPTTTAVATTAVLRPTSSTTRLGIPTTTPQPSAAAAGAITSVVFSGGEVSPVITITGRSLGSRPPAYPPAAPSKFQFQDGKANCNATARDEGLDYGTQLYVHTDENNFTAGRYRVADPPELDCVGLIVDEFTDTRVVLRLGGAYDTGRVRRNFTMKKGYHFEVGVNAAVSRGVLRYT